MTSEKAPLNPQTTMSDEDAAEIQSLFVPPIPLDVPSGSSQPAIVQAIPVSNSAPQKVETSIPLLPAGSQSSSGEGQSPDTVPSDALRGSLPYNTLTEPVAETLKRDVFRVASNIRKVLLPNPYREDIGSAFRDWDLWGPFFFIIFLALVLSASAPGSQSSTVFATVFAVLSVGAVALTLNVLLLGGRIIFLQSLSVLGYCLFPLDLGSLACLFLSSKFLQLLIVLITLAWSSWACYPFVAGSVPEARRALAVYPVLLLYISVGLLVLANDS